MGLILISTVLQARSHLIPFEDAVTLNNGAALKAEQCCIKICCTASGHSCELFYSSTKTTEKLSHWYFRKQEIISKLLPFFHLGLQDNVENCPCFQQIAK